MEASAGFSGPYPTEAAAEAHSEIEEPSPGVADETSAGSTSAGPSVAHEAHSELEADSPAPAGNASPGNTAAPPTVASAIAPGPNAIAEQGTSLSIAAHLSGQGEAAAGYSGSRPSLPSEPIVALGAQLAGVASSKPEEASSGYRGALPTLASTHYPAPYGPGAVIPAEQHG